MKDFFVSYNRHDRAWAEWIAWMLEEAGYTTVIQAWDFRAGGNFVLDMQKAASEAQRTIAVLSETYLASEFTQPEWAAAFAQDPTGKERKLIPVRVKECQLSGLLRPIVYIDLVDVAEAEAQDVLLRSLSQDRAKPDQKPRFPRSAASGGNSFGTASHRPKPVFPPNIPSNLPLTSAIFVGRDDELERLHTQLQTKALTVISAVSGMGGIGKTELAAQYALQQRDMGTYPGGICWLRAREDLSTQIVLFTRSQLGLTISEDLELAEQVSLCWRNWQPGETLVVFDDVQQYQDIASVLPPQRSQFRVLLTTRLTLQSPVQNFEIKVLSEEKAIELLRAFATQGRAGNDPRFSEANADLEKQLCQWLGCLPLGLELVGRYLARKPDTSLETLWQRLQDKRLEAKALKDAAPEMTAPLGVTAAFELSWEVLDEPARRLAALLSLFALAEIPWTLVEACYPEEDVEDIEDLRDESLLNLHLLERIGEGTYQLHQLLREFFAAKREQRAEMVEMKQWFRLVVLEAVKRSTETPERSLLAETTMLLPHLQAVVQLSETSEQAIDVAIDLAWLANLYYSQGRYEEAEPLYLRALEISKEQLGENHPDVSNRLNNLASLYHSQGRYEEAKPLLLRALEISKEQLGENHPDIAIWLNNLAGLHRSQGRYEEAEPLLLRALEISKEQLGENHPDIAIWLNNLAELYRSQGRYGEAELLYQQALAISEEQLGRNHLQFAASLHNLANLYCLQGRYKEAEPLLLRALEISKEQLGENHPDIATKLHNLASLYRSQERYGEAEPLLLRALEISEERLGENHPDIATSVNNLALLYDSQGRYEETEPLYLRALAISKEQLGENHPDIATWLHNLAGLYELQRLYEKAEPLYQQALTISEEQLGENHPQFAASLNNLANLYRSQGRYEEAEPLHLRCLAIQRQALGENHPQFAGSLNNLANLYRWQGRCGEAEPLFLRALAVLFNHLGTDHPNSQQVWQNFQAFLWQVIRAEQTAQLSDHPVTQDLLRQMQMENDNA
ncbi:tetratricopeptide repeat protein [Leptolyngbya sp. FACHB-541]|uniref:tetratricopeptide repeat protein n=1 Tax=Leptolyngbya sp. FACHB-541 TaxID=2692810 RepID=UPI0016824A69|nr:tetratricopeptide repeat protein [Leptolyngbya sp. FACHB-541]MBD1996292.1 tetratricopeptide repeat protein [Leptolyngbya sp. FACHB-541]